tara:strand:+ start:564 stop:2348 length:1785 start_codon:yes stop_codon:yes gene_type:complete
MSGLEETREELDDITRLFTRSSKEAFKMKTEIMGMNAFVEGKNYQILSRFLSGTGAWKILNKAKATIMTMVQLMDRAERKTLQEAKRFESLTKALDDRQKLQNLQAALEADNIDAIKANFKHFDAMVEILGSKEKVLASIAEKTSKQLEIQKDIVAAATDERSTLTKLREWAGGLKKKAVDKLPSDVERKQITLLYALTGTSLAQLAQSHKEFKYIKKIAEFTSKQAKRPLTAYEKFMKKMGLEREKEINERGLEAFETDKVEDYLHGIFGFERENIRLAMKLFSFTEAKQGIQDIREKIQEKYAKLTLWYQKFSMKVWWKGVKKNLKLMAQFFMRMLFYFTVLVTGAFIVYRLLKAIEPSIRTGFSWAIDAFNALSFIAAWGLETIGAGIENIRSGFASGNFLEVLQGVFQIWLGLIVTGLGIVVAVLGAALAGLAGLLLGQWDTSKSILHNIATVVRTLLYVAAAVAMIGAYFLGWPALLVGLILAGIAVLWDTMMSYIWPMADGGTVRGGVQLVGERGPELVRLPRGSRVYSNGDSTKMLSSSGNGTVIHNNITVTGRVGASDSEIKDIANKLSRELNNRMNRTGSAVSGF